LKLGPAWRVDSELEQSRVEEKIKEGKARCDRLIRLTQQDPIKNPVATC
jgi:hypothetical protein